MNEQDSQQPSFWSEQNSQQFIDYAEYFVPHRQEQMEVICQLIPVMDRPIHVLELCCGEGLLAQHILTKRPDIRITGMDGSEAMLWKARQRLSPFGSRFSAITFDLHKYDWRKMEFLVQAVISSLAIHHLNGEAKQRLYRDLYTLLSPGGALIIADLIEPAGESARHLAARRWDLSVQERSLELDQNLQRFETFKHTQWNLYHFPDPVDMPSRLVDHFQWLANAGFIETDVYWMEAGHAIYGGIKPTHQQNDSLRQADFYLIKEHNMIGKTIPFRKDIPQEYTWNSESVFASIQDWENEVSSLQHELKNFQDAQAIFSLGATQLAEVLEKRDAITQRLMVVLMYAIISHEVDKNDQQAAMLPGKAFGLAAQGQAASAFIEPGILAIGEEKILDWAKNEPRLNIYTHYLQDLFRKQAHVRSAEAEELLGMLSDPFSNTMNTAGILTDADLKFLPAMDSNGAEHEVTQGSLPGILSRSDREARQTAWEHYNDGFLSFKNTLASNLITSIKQNVFMMRARRFSNTLEASLFPHNIPEQVFHNLIDTFKKNLPTWHRYFEIRKRVLGVEKLYPYDMWAPLTKERAQIDFHQAVEWICQGLAPMGADYTETIRKGCLEQRWVDIYPNQGKSAGAFSFGTKGTYPFIVMNYTGEIFSLSTLAHELGHSMHSYLTWQNQPTIYSDYSLFVAEVASNFHQAMVRSHLLNLNPDSDFVIGIIEEAMANFYRYFLIMPTLARFELEIHRRIERGEGVNAEGMIDLMADLFQEAYGDTVEVDRQRVGITWATFGHLYQDYYVYQYATGISAAHALSNRILDGEPGAVDDYLGFLKSGSSGYPLDVLMKAGVDLTSPEPVEQTFEILANLVKRLESLI